MKAHGSTWLRPRAFPAVVAAVLAAASISGVGLWAGYSRSSSQPAPGEAAKAGATGPAPGTVAVLAPGLAADVPGAERLGPLAPTAFLNLSLGLKLRDVGALDRLLDQGRTVPTAEYDGHFGPAPGSVHLVEGWLRSQGLRVSWSPGDSVLEAGARPPRRRRPFLFRSVAIA